MCECDRHVRDNKHFSTLVTVMSKQSVCQNASHAGGLTVHAIVQNVGIMSPIEVGQLQVGAGGIKTLFGNFPIINEGLEGLQAIQELVYIVHHLCITTWIGT